jgi:putative transcriptional regulator
MGEHKLKISDLASATGINRGTLTRLYHETAERVELDVVNVLCSYFDCQIQDLFEFRKDDE